jgi:outer membrane protein OmpA-like peptidoglycan-associated protein
MGTFRKRVAAGLTALLSGATAAPSLQAEVQQQGASAMPEEVRRCENKDNVFDAEVSIQSCTKLIDASTTSSVEKTMALLLRARQLIRSDDLSSAGHDFDRAVVLAPDARSRSIALGERGRARVQAGQVPLGEADLANAREIHEQPRPQIQATSSESGCFLPPNIVFFAEDSDSLTPQAVEILNRVAKALLRCSLMQVNVGGHTDRAGTESYNLDLSRRQATKVRDYLTGKGVPAGVMTIEAFGESRPWVETADGIREPQNRRVEITFGPPSGW